MSSTISPSEGLSDYESRIETALGTYSGTITLEGPGVLEASELDSGAAAMNITHEAGCILKRLPAYPDSPNDSVRAAFKFSSGSSGTYAGSDPNNRSVIDARGAYSGIGSYTGSGAIVIENVHVQDASYKAFNLNSDAIVRDCSSASTISTGLHMAFLADLESGPTNYLKLHNFVCGPAQGSTEGQCVKVAQCDDVDIRLVRTPNPDADTVYSLVWAEDVGDVLVRQSSFPRLVSHFPDTGDASVDVLVYEDVTFGDLDVNEGLLLLDHIQARIVVFINCRFNSNHTVILDDETPAADLRYRLFFNCNFHAEQDTTLIFHDDGASTLLGKVFHSGCTSTGSGTITYPADWNDNEMTIPSTYDTRKIWEAFV